MKKTLSLCLALCAIFCVRFTAYSFAAQPAAQPRQNPQIHTNSIGMEFVQIPAGSFTRTFTTRNEKNEEQKKHSTFIISKPFYLGKCQVTQEQWEAVMGENPSSFKGRANPVENVSWHDAQEFIKRLNNKEKHRRYRLPTEAEWELAARGGTDMPLFFVKASMMWEEAAAALDAYAWFGKNSGDTTHPVGQKKPNPYGLYDIYGNVWEWVQDGYGELPTVPEIRDYRGQAEDSLRVLRGGCWVCKAELFRAGNRLHAPTDKRNGHIGLRVAFSPE